LIFPVWAVKTCLLIMYYRLTIVHKENVAVIALAVYVAFAFIFMEIFYFGVWCRPFHNYWAVPAPDPQQCSAAIHHLITNAVFNISSDLLTLALALQLFIRSKLPARRKLVLCGIFGLGAFVILAAVLNKYYSFRFPFGSQWTFWYIRESSTAILVANLPFMWTLLRRVFKLGSFENPNSRNASWDANSYRGPRDGSWPASGTYQHRTWWKRMVEEGRRLSAVVLSGIDSNSKSRPTGSSRSPFASNGSQGFRDWKRPWNVQRGTSYREDSNGAHSQEPILSPRSMSPHRNSDPEAQRQPWDELDLGEFLTEGNTLDIPGTPKGPSRRKSYGGNL
jgi:hypothetical protein